MDADSQQQAAAVISTLPFAGFTKLFVSGGAFGIVCFAFYMLLSAQIEQAKEDRITIREGMRSVDTSIQRQTETIRDLTTEIRLSNRRVLNNGKGSEE